MEKKGDAAAWMSTKTWQKKRTPAIGHEKAEEQPIKLPKHGPKKGIPEKCEVRRRKQSEWEGGADPHQNRQNDAILFRNYLQWTRKWTTGVCGAFVLPAIRVRPPFCLRCSPLWTLPARHFSSYFFSFSFVSFKRPHNLTCLYCDTIWKLSFRNSPWEISQMG